MKWLGPKDAGFQAACANFSTQVIHAPEYVAVVESEADVATALREAQSRRLSVRIQATGHGAYAPVSSGLLLSTRPLRKVMVDAERSRVTLGAGARWSEVVSAASSHGLCAIAGSASTVGVVGYLLGGGIGPLVRSHGFGSDYVESFRVAVASGEILDVHASSHPDLFWALRGGKGGLGVVTEVCLKLIKLPSIYGGCLYFDEPHIDTALNAWMQWTRGAASEITTSVFIAQLPSWETIPVPLRNRRTLALRFACPTWEGAGWAAPLRNFAPVLLDELRPLPTDQLDTIHNDPTEPSAVWLRGQALSSVDAQLATTLLRHLDRFDGLEIRHLGAAAARDVPEGSAAGGRDARYSLTRLCFEPSRFGSEIESADARLMDDLRPWVSNAGNINLMVEPTSAAHFSSAWPASTLARLQQVRRQYDPEGRFPFGFRT